MSFPAHYQPSCALYRLTHNPQTLTAFANVDPSVPSQKRRRPPNPQLIRIDSILFKYWVFYIFLFYHVLVWLHSEIFNGLGEV